MKVKSLFIVLTFLGQAIARADEKDLPLGIWKPVEVWVDGKTQKPERSHLRLYVNDRKQWAFGGWPDYPDLSEAKVVDDSFRLRGVPFGTLVLPEHFRIWTTIDVEPGIMILSSLQSDRAIEQRTIKKYAIRNDKLFVLQVSCTVQPAKHWWGYAERHGDLGGGFYVGKCPSAGPVPCSKNDRMALAAIKIPARPDDTAEASLAKSMPKLESGGRPYIPRLQTEVVIYERVDSTEPQTHSLH